MAEGDVVPIEQELEAWWESLSEDVRAAVLSADRRVPGWIIASAVAAHIEGPAHSSTEPPDKFAVDVHDALAEFIARKRAD